LNIDETDGTLVHSHEGLAGLEAPGRQDQLLELRKSYQVSPGSSKGLSAIEVIIALAVLGIIAAAFLSGLATTLNATRIADEHSTAQSLAQSQMEYVKSQGYDSTNNPPQYSVDPNLPIPNGYTIEVAPERLDPKGDGTGNDDGIQKITITIKHGDKVVLTLEDYKVNR